MQGNRFFLGAKLRGNFKRLEIWPQAVFRVFCRNLSVLCRILLPETLRSAGFAGCARKSSIVYYFSNPLRLKPLEGV